MLTQNEIDAANSVRLDHLNAQGQPRFEWPATFALARAYLDQLERSGGLAPDDIGSARDALASAERASGGARSGVLSSLATDLSEAAASASDPAKVRLLRQTVVELAGS